MEMEMPTTIIAIVTMKPENLKGGGVPVFITEDAESLQALSSTLEKTLDASAHEVDQSTMMIVVH